VPDQEETHYSLVPMVAEFLRRHRPEVVAETGNRLEKRAYALIVENGYQEYDCFPLLDAGWPSAAPALPLFLTGPSERLQNVCDALATFLNFTGRWDELLSLAAQAESKALIAADHAHAGRRAHEAGCVYVLREQADAVLVCADRAAAHWQAAIESNGQVGTRERAIAIQLRGRGHQLKSDYAAAIAAYREAVELDRSLSAESEDVAIDLNDIALVEFFSGDPAAARRDFLEALRISNAAGDVDGMATVTGNLAVLALARKDWLQAETLAREALSLSERVGRQELIAEGLPFARRAVEIYTRLDLPGLEHGREILAECEK
jgi:tetratricopeptide (TPR) repeat protein